MSEGHINTSILEFFDERIQEAVNILGVFWAGDAPSKHNIAPEEANFWVKVKINLSLLALKINHAARHGSIPSHTRMRGQTENDLLDLKTFIPSVEKKKARSVSALKSRCSL